MYHASQPDMCGLLRYQRVSGGNRDGGLVDDAEKLPLARYSFELSYGPLFELDS